MTSRKPAYAWFVVLALALLGPVLKSGYLLLLDAPTGPAPDWPEFFPTPSDGLFSAGFPTSVVMRTVAVAATLIAPELFNKALVFLALVAGGIGMYRFAARDLRADALAAAAGATLFVVNPFTYERVLAGQLFLVAAYALMPWALPSITRLVNTGSWSDLLRGALWTAVITVVDVHVGGITLLVLLVCALLSPAPWRTRAAHAGCALGALVATNAYWVLPSLLDGEGTALGGDDLSIFAPRPRSASVLIHELLLHGFWRDEFADPLTDHKALFLGAFIALLACIALGIVHGIRDPDGPLRRLTIALSACAGMALVLGMGISFPLTEPLARLVYEVVPGYAIYREPQKWVALLALFYGIYAAIGLAWLQRLGQTKKMNLVPVAGFALGLPLLATSTMLWGFGGRVEPAQFPREWTAADSLMKGAEGNLLVLPWFQFYAFDFAQSRVLDVPVAEFFSIDAIESDDDGYIRREVTEIEDPRKAYVSELLDDFADGDELGSALAPYDVRYVMLLEPAENELEAVLAAQPELRSLLDGDDIALYENDAWHGDVYSLTEAATRSSSTWGSGLIQSLWFWDDVATEEAEAIGTDKSCDDGWRLGDQAAACHLGAFAAFRTSSSEETLWRPGVVVQLLSYGVSLAAGGVLVRFVRRSPRPGEEIVDA